MRCGQDIVQRPERVIRRQGLGTFVRGTVKRFRPHTGALEQSEIHPRERSTKVASI